MGTLLQHAATSMPIATKDGRSRGAENREYRYNIDGLKTGAILPNY